MLKLEVTGAASLAGCNHRSQFNSLPAPYNIEVSGHQLTLSTYVIGAGTATIALWLRECFLANEPIQELLVPIRRDIENKVLAAFSDRRSPGAVYRITRLPSFHRLPMPG